MMKSTIDIKQLKAHPDIGPILEKCRIVPIAAEIITTLRNLAEQTPTYSITFEDGSQAKCRILQSPGHARRVYSLRQKFHIRGFSQIFQQHGAALLEEWIPGVSMNDAMLSDTVLQEIGQNLGELHNTALNRKKDHPLAQAGFWCSKFRQAMYELQLRELLSEEEVHRFELHYQAKLSSGIALGIIHQDFSIKNFVMSQANDCICVDNETLDFGPLALDIARMWLRWPMRSAQHKQFFEGYRKHAHVLWDKEELNFWHAFVTLESAVYHQRQDTTLRKHSVRRLQQFTKTRLPR